MNDGQDSDILQAIYRQKDKGRSMDIHSFVYIFFHEATHFTIFVNFFLSCGSATS